MPRVVHFEFTAEDPDRASTFYRNVFGWQFTKWDGPEDYWIIKTGENEPGIDGGMLRRREGSPNATTSINVDSLDRHLDLITREGGTVIVPPTDVPKVGSYAFCKDTEGNIFSVMQPEQS